MEGFLGNSMVGVVLNPTMSVPLLWWQRAQDSAQPQSHIDWLATMGVRAAEARDLQLEHEVRF